MSEVAELSATELATRLLPLLKEYTEKMRDLAERLSSVNQRFVLSYSKEQATLVSEASRLLCLRFTVDQPVRDLAQEASGLIEHAALEFQLRAELKLRLSEIEEHIRFAKSLSDLIITQMSGLRILEAARQVAVLSGRYKAPF
ncbi:MAG: hypothetical protein FJ304_04760 [Planctomycetes bacterium]|nr:hypothetical protein [Planctomycetota bacterium]